jgi:hypothetical protein
MFRSRAVCGRHLAPAVLSRCIARDTWPSELTVQRIVAIRHAVTMTGVVLPRPLSIGAVRKPVVVIVDPGVVMVPVPAAEEEAVTDDDPAAPGEVAIPAVAVPWTPENRRIVRPPPRTIDDRRVVIRHVHEVGIRRCDVDVIAVLLHLHLRAGLQIPRYLCLVAQFLDGIHDLGLLRQKRVAHTFGPFDLLVHRLQDLRKRDQRFHARIPIHVAHSQHRRLTALVGVGVIARPACGFDHFQRIGRGHQDLREQRIWIQRDWRQHLVELLLGEGRIVCCRGWALRESAGRRQGQGEHQVFRKFFHE